MTIKIDTKKTAKFDFMPDELEVFRNAIDFLTRIQDTLEDNEEGYTTTYDFVSYEDLSTASSVLTSLINYNQEIVDIVTK